MSMCYKRIVIQHLGCEKMTKGAGKEFVKLDMRRSYATEHTP